MSETRTLRVCLLRGARVRLGRIIAAAAATAFEFRALRDEFRKLSRATRTPKRYAARPVAVVVVVSVFFPPQRRKPTANGKRFYIKAANTARVVRDFVSVPILRLLLTNLFRFSEYSHEDDATEDGEKIVLVLFSHLNSRSKRTFKKRF